MFVELVRRLVAGQQRIGAAVCWAFASLGLNVTCYWAAFPAQEQFSKYSRAAEQYLGGLLGAERLADFSPLYFWTHVLATRLFGDSQRPVLCLQLLAVALATGGLFLLLDRYTQGKWLPLAGVICFCLSGSVVTYSAVLEPEAFLLLFLVGFLYFVTGTSSGSFLWAGVFLGLCLLTRPTFLPLLVILPIWLWGRDAGRRRFVSLLGVLGPPVLAVFVLCLLNVSTVGIFSPTVMNPGFVFYEGNNPLSTGQSAVYPPLVQEVKVDIPGAPDNPHMTYRTLARLDAGAALTTFEANRFWFSKALNYIKDQPLRWIDLLATKAYFLLHSFRRYDIQVAYAYNHNLTSGYVWFVPFAFLAAAALPGFILSLRNWRRDFPVLSVFVIQASVMLITYVSDRQRLPLLPVMILFACLALSRLQQDRRWRTLLLVGITLLGVVLSVPVDVMRDNDHIWRQYIKSDQEWLAAVALRAESRFQEASLAAARSYAAAPWLGDYARPAWLSFGQAGFASAALNERPGSAVSCSERFDQGVLLLAAKQFTAAEQLLQKVSNDQCRFDRVALQSSRPEFYLARTAFHSGDEQKAKRFLAEALAEAPGDPFVLSDLVVLTGEQRYHQWLVDYYGEVHTLFLEALAFVELQKPGAVARLEKFVSMMPELRRSAIYYAAALGSEGDDALAARVYQQATLQRSDPVLLEGQILGIFRRLAIQSAQQPGTHHNFSYVLAQFGRFEEALAEELRAYELLPSPESKRAINMLRERVVKNQ